MDVGITIQKVSDAMLDAGRNELKDISILNGGDIGTDDLSSLVTSIGVVTLKRIVSNCAEKEGIPYKKLITSVLAALIQKEGLK